MTIDLTPGALLAGRYRLDHVLGEGGMGMVWAAGDVESGGAVALKLIKGASDNPGARRLFVREARASSAVRHPNVVTVHEVLELEDGSPVIVMELLVGETLADRLRREGRLTLSELAAVLTPVISAVGAAHALGVIHRDLKPANIWLTPGPGAASGVKVLDFGIAKVISTEAVEAAKTGGITTTGLVIGTPAYMAPEQLFGDKDMDHRVDVWALGLIAYQCLSSTLPTGGDSVGQILKGVLSRPIPPLERLVPDLPQEVARLVDGMLSRAREARPALREVKEMLSRYTTVRAPAFGAPVLSLEAGRAVALPENAVALTAQPRGSRGPGRWSRRLLVGAGLVASLAAGAGLWRARSRAARAEPSSPVSPLAPATAVLGCPILKASGVAEPAGWLGAAAAATICDRARILLGGRTERIRVPAELLDLPREPVDSFPVDPFGEPGARARSLTAARERSSAYVDGDVEKTPSGYRVSLSLLSPDGRALGQATGQGRALYEAIREAMNALAHDGALPRATALDPVIADWSRARDIDSALAMLDVQLGMANNAGGLPEDCARLEKRSADVAEMGPGERWRCAYTLGLPTPAIDVPSLAGAAPAAFAGSARVSLMINEGADYREAAARMHAFFERETSPWGRSLLAATESCLLQPSDPQRAREMALLAVKAEPKNPDGQLCTPWGQLLTVTSDTSSAGSAMRAMQGWSPWNSNCWSAEASTSIDAARALTYARRAYALTPFDTNAADILADRLLAAGEREEARGVALGLVAGGYPVHRVESDLLLGRIDASEARFGAALARAKQALVVTPEDGGYVRVQRMEVGWRALEVATLLGREAEIADLLVARFIELEPPPLDGIYTSVQLRAAAFCAYASPAVARRCFARLASLASRGQFQSSIPGTDAFMEGARRYAEHDYPRAAKAWRPLLRTPGVLTSAMPEAMAATFERTGDVELCEQLDAAALAGAGRFNGASFAQVRAARRAAARHEGETARALAKQVIAAWSVADETVPAVEEMRALVAKLR